jgi:gamma-glutamyltranspeptidase/glutathione hydrolase
MRLLVAWILALAPAWAQTSTWRPVVLGREAMVVSGHYLTAQAAWRMLEQGGNAIDAAVAAAFTSTVVEPSRAGIGGHSTILVYLAKTGSVRYVNGNGWAPAAATPAYFAARGGIPLDGPLTPVVPGAVAGLLEAAEKYGKLERAKLLAPSIELAERGFAVSENLHNVLRRNADRLKRYPESTRLWFRGGEPLRMGEVVRQPELARTLRLVASGGREAFYRGPIAAGLARTFPLLTAEDLAGYRADESEPLQLNYKGHELYMAPPSSYGHVMLEALSILEGFDLRKMGHNSADYLHHVAEALKLAFADREAHAADGKDVTRLLSKEYASRRRALIRPERAMEAPAPPGEGGTTYVGVVDRERNMVSITSTISSDFGSCLTAQGFFVNNWMSLFRPEAESPNVVAPRKRPRHGLSPVLVMQAGQPRMVFGTPGGDTIPQAQLQFFLNFAEFGMNVQQAVEQPYVVSSAFVASRVPYGVAGKLSLSNRISQQVREELARRGHRVETHGTLGVGSVKAILVNGRAGVLMGAAAPATDSYAVGW